ncbi:MAG: GH3 auxin-responsive promoter family protein [Gemmatales bacterium]|nr:GH3 auxin-responsive promoter family protein [Gemmatales bacterium]MDW8386352.1 GH3 auxin-responsive promoter family protein [Gemmatales bacterium]
MIRWLLRKILKPLAVLDARRKLAAFEEATKHPRELQEAIRQRIIAKQRDTQFGREHRFDEIRTLADFRRNLPISRYEDYEPYIRLLRAGRLDALVSDRRIYMFAMTSGTTAQRKYIPVTPAYLADYRRGWTVWGMKLVEQYGTQVFNGILQFISDHEEFRTEAGIPCGSVTGLTAQMQKAVVRWMYVMPAVTAKIKDSHAKYYTALRLALQRDIRLITAANPSTLVNFARFMDQEKERLLRDLHDGTLSRDFDIPIFVREAIRPKLKKLPERTRELETVIRTTGTLYPKDAWKTLLLLGNWMGGNVKAYLRHYPRYYGDLPVRDPGLIASEGRMSIPIENGTASGVLDVASHFFEFIPKDEIDSPSPTVLLAHELRDGEEYFILLTTSYGLYRYNIYDLVRVTGFHNETPLIEFLNKGSSFSNLTGEKLSEFQVVQAVQEALAEMHLTLTAYCLAPGWDEEDAYYGLFVEQTDFAGPDQALALAEAVDRHLRRLNIEYDAKRESRRLGPIRPVLLTPGAWGIWDKQRLARTGGTPEQYKHPCLISDPALRQQLPIERELIPEDAVHARC